MGALWVSGCVTLIRNAEEIPENLMRQMSTCQTAANEFLRHYWHSIYPPPSQASLPLTETIRSQRAAKAAKMAGYLASTHEKVGAIVKAAPYEKVDPKRVELVSMKVLRRQLMLTYVT